MFHGAEILVSLLDVIAGEVEICFLGHAHAGMAENFAEREHVHAVHQAPLGEVVA